MAPRATPAAPAHARRRYFSSIPIPSVDPRRCPYNARRMPAIKFRRIGYLPGRPSRTAAAARTGGARACRHRGGAFRQLLTFAKLTYLYCTFRFRSTAASGTPDRNPPVGSTPFRFHQRARAVRRKEMAGRVNLKARFRCRFAADAAIASWRCNFKLHLATISGAAPVIPRIRALAVERIQGLSRIDAPIHAGYGYNDHQAASK